ncbi:MAG: sigma-70 family RNA polymerase sigma factor [Chloroflexota bacterium]|nr:sigma-70 family RNA polymerase sigma factor [Chloroflexota bacterium]
MDASRVTMTGTLDAPGDDAEAAMIVRARDDPAEFAPLYSAYFSSVYHYCLRSLGEREAAADATSQVFIKALGALPTYRSGSFRSWLFTIAHNVLVDASRRRRLYVPLDDAGDIPSPESMPEERALAAEDGRRLAALLACLPPSQRQIVELRLAGLTGPEIARTLGISHAAVKSRQFRAYSTLRDVIGKRHDADRREDADVVREG